MTRRVRFLYPPKAWKEFEESPHPAPAPTTGQVEFTEAINWTEVKDTPNSVEDGE